MLDPIGIARRLLGRRGRRAARSIYDNVKLKLDKIIVASQRRRHPADPLNRKLNFGAGPWHHKGWEVVDLYIPDAYIDYHCDFRGMPKIPLVDGCASMIFCSHLIEHMDDKAALNLMTEAFRLLRKGGILRLATPHGQAAINAYRRGDEDFFDNGGVYCVGPTIEHKLANYFSSFRLPGSTPKGPEIDPTEVSSKSALPLYEFIDWCVSLIPEEAEYIAHVNGYDERKLLAMLREAGFVDPVISHFRGSVSPEFRGSRFDNRPTVSLFAEAVK